MFSRWMPPYEHASLGPRGRFVLAVVALGALIVLALHPSAAVIALGVVGFLALVTLLLNGRISRWASDRAGENIGTFARAFDRRAPTFDPWVVRAVWDALAPWTIVRGRRLPLRPSDELADLGCVGSDVDEVFNEAATRARRSVSVSKTNPYYGQVKTVGDLVGMISHQPRETAA